MSQTTIEKILAENRPGNPVDAIRSVVALFQKENEEKKELLKKNEQLITILKNIKNVSFSDTNISELFEDICTILNSLPDDLLTTESEKEQQSFDNKYYRLDDGDLIKVGDLIIIDSGFGQKQYVVSRVSKTLAFHKLSDRDYEIRFKRVVDTRNMAHPAADYPVNTYFVYREKSV